MADANCKYELINSLCNTCLGIDKKLICYDNTSNIYQILALNLENKIHDDYIQICPECTEIVVNFAAFRQEALKSLDTLLQNINGKNSEDPLDFSEDYSELKLIEPKREPSECCNVNYEIEIGALLDSVKNETDEDGADVVGSGDAVKPVSRVKSNCKRVRKRKTHKLSTKKVSYADNFIVKSLSESEMLQARINEKNKKPNKRAFWCDTCILTYANERELIKHNQTLHTQKEGHTQCAICQQYVQDKWLETHRQSHYLIYECKVCREHVYNPKIRGYHYETKHDTRIYSCNDCGTSFMTKSAVKHHRAKVHGQNFECEFCGKHFDLKAIYTKHLLIHTDTSLSECPVCKKQVRSMHLKHHVRLTHAATANPNAYCAECDKHFKNLQEYRQHVKYTERHIPVKNLYSCQHCGKRFSNKFNLKKHIDRVHLKRYNQPCQHCGKIFTENRRLRDHIARVHEGEEPIRDKICDHCGKGFFCKQALEQHTRQHTGERPYVCDICEQTFSYSGALYTHKKLVHKIIKKSATPVLHDVPE